MPHLSIMNIEIWVNEKRKMLDMLKNVIPAHTKLIDFIIVRLNTVSLEMCEELASRDPQGTEADVSKGVSEILAKLHHFLSPMLATLRELVRSAPIVTEEAHVREAERMPRAAKMQFNLAYHQNLNLWGSNQWLQKLELTMEYKQVRRHYYRTREHALHGKFWDKIGDPEGVNPCTAKGPYLTQEALRRLGVQIATFDPVNVPSQSAH